jgi:hypothetical protein
MAIVNANITTGNTEVLDPDGLNPGAFSGAVPEGKSYAITNILVCNTSASAAATFTMHLVPRGENITGNKTTVIKDLELPALETFTFDSERIVLEEGDKIIISGFPDDGGGGTETTLAATISYLEV